MPLRHGRFVIAAPASLLAAFASSAGPSTSAWPTSSSGECVAAAAAAVAGWFATADASSDSIDVRTADQALVRTITRADLSALLPWMSLSTSFDGPDALAFSDSGRLLFIAVHDANAASDGKPSDAILRYDTESNSLSVFARLELAAADNPATHGALVHFRGVLYVGTASGIAAYRAQANDTVGTPLVTTAVGAGAQITGLAVDRSNRVMYASWGSTLARATIPASGPTSTPLSFVPVGTASAPVLSLAWSDQYGGPSNAGLYWLDSSAGNHRLWTVTPAQAQGTQAFSPTLYSAASGTWHDLAATADGALLATGTGGATLVRDTSDARLALNAWAADEFRQNITFAKGLVTTGPGAGGPPGWVIDSDVIPSWSRFHPACPDAAGWAVMLFILSDALNHDAAALPYAKLVLTRYAGLAADGIKPLRNADGIYWHWIDPNTGNAKAGWGDSYATMSTMLIVSAAAKARLYWPNDPDIRAASQAIVCGVSNWDRYFDANANMFLLANAAGGGNTPSSGWHEGVLFAEQAGAYGSTNGPNASARWLTRGYWPYALTVTGYPMTSDGWGAAQSAFITLYALDTVAPFRASAEWQAHVRAVRVSHAAWTDDNGPRLSTVFSAGSNPSGYNADNLGNHPNDITTLTALEGLAAGDGASPPRIPELVGAYNAYRRGARESFLSGASMLYRRSDSDPTYTPNAAALVDTAFAAVGLAEYLSPGITAQTLAMPYPVCPACPPDINGDGFVDIYDFSDYVSCFEGNACPLGQNADFNGDGFVDIYDFSDFIVAFEAGC